MPHSVNINVPQPSYYQGFARSAGESAHTNLWKGLFSAWSPELGPTGLTLRDVSGFQNHGTLTNILATDWVVSDGAYSIKGTDTDDHILVPSPGGDFGEFTLLQWINPDTWAFFKSFDWTGASLLRIGATATAGDLLITFSVEFSQTDFTVSGAIANGEMQLIAVTRDGAGVVRAHVNGVLQPGSLTKTGTWSPSGDLRIGDPANSIRGKYGAVYFYNRKLTENEQRQFYSIGRSGIFQRRPVTIAKAPAVVAAGFIPIKRRRIIYEILHNRS